MALSSDTPALCTLSPHYSRGLPSCFSVPACPVLPLPTNTVSVLGVSSFHSLPCSISIHPSQFNSTSLCSKASPGPQTRPRLPGVHVNCPFHAPHAVRMKNMTNCNCLMFNVGFQTPRVQGRRLSCWQLIPKVWNNTFFVQNQRGCGKWMNEYVPSDWLLICVCPCMGSFASLGPSCLISRNVRPSNSCMER